MPLHGFRSSRSGTHLPALLHSNSAGSSANPANIPIPQTPGAPSGVSFSGGFGGDDLAATTPSGSYGSNSYFPSMSGTTTPASDFGSYTMGTPAHGPSGGHSWIEIVLDQEQVVLRGAGGDTNPAQLSGRVLLHLVESTSLKDVTLQLTGKAKVAFGEGAGYV